MASILLVSDNPPALELVRSALVTAGHDVLVAPDPGAVGRKGFDLAIVDFERAEAAAQVRSVAEKVVLFSDQSEEVTRERVRASGAFGYVRKLGPERLREDIGFLLSA